MFMQIAVGAVGIAITLMIGYIVVAQVRASMPTQPSTMSNASWGNLTAGMETSQSTISAGFGLIAVGVIVLAAFGLIRVFS